MIKKTILMNLLMIGLIINPSFSSDMNTEVNPFDGAARTASLKGVAYEPLEIEVTSSEEPKTEAKPWYKNKRIWYAAGICTAVVATTAGVTYGIIKALSGDHDDPTHVVIDSPTASVSPFPSLTASMTASVTALASITASATTSFANDFVAKCARLMPKNIYNPSPYEEIFNETGRSCQLWNVGTTYPIGCCEGESEEPCMPFDDYHTGYPHYYNCPTNNSDVYLCQKDDNCLIETSVTSSTSFSPSVTPSPEVNIYYLNQLCWNKWPSGDYYLNNTITIGSNGAGCFVWYNDNPGYSRKACCVGPGRGGLSIYFNYDSYRYGCTAPAPSWNPITPPWAQQTFVSCTCTGQLIK